MHNRLDENLMATAHAIFSPEKRASGLECPKITSFMEMKGTRIETGILKRAGRRFVPCGHDGLVTLS